MKSILTVLLVVIFYSILGQNLNPYPFQEDNKLAWFEPSDTPFEVGQYEKLEIGIALPDDIQYRIDNFINDINRSKSINPFLEWEIKVTADFFLNGELIKTVDGFFYKEFERNLSSKVIYARTWDPIGETYQREDANFNFRIRASLPKLGEYTCKITAQTKEQNISFAPFKLKVVNSENKGFIKVGKNNRYFTLGGETFYFIGQNVQWPSKSGQCINKQGVSQNLCQPMIETDFYCPVKMMPPDAYINFYKYLDTLSNHINFIRTMMVPWSWDFEYEKVGNYYKRQNIAWEMDRFFELCHEKGIYVNFDLSWGAELANPNVYGGAIWDWYDHPDNQVAPRDENFYDYKTKFNLKTIDEFRRHPGVKKFYAQKLRYFVSRYGYSTNLTMIEVVNEMNGKEYEEISGRNSAETWHKFVCDYIKDSLKADQLTAVNYGNGYEVCTQNNICSGGTSDGDLSYSLDNVDVASFNFYTGPSPNKQVGLSFKFNKNKIGKAYNRWYYNLNKPIIIGETGSQENYAVCAPQIFDGYDNAAILSMAGFAGILMWDDKPELYNQYHQLSSFMNEIDLDGKDFQPIVPNFNSKYTHKSLNKMKRKDDKAIFYYLKSSQRNPEVVGAIQNLTFNEYSMRDTFWDDGYNANGKKLPEENHWKDTLPCASSYLNMPCDDLEWDQYNNQLNYGQTPYSKAENLAYKANQKLNIYDLDLGKYKTEFYGAFNFKLLDTAIDGGFVKTLHHPILNEENRIVLFKMKKLGITGQPSTIPNLNNSKSEYKSLEINFQKEGENYCITTNEISQKLKYELYDLKGKLIQSDNINSTKHTLYISYSDELLLFVIQDNRIVYRDHIDGK